MMVGRKWLGEEFVGEDNALSGHMSNIGDKVSRKHWSTAGDWPGLEYFAGTENMLCDQHAHRTALRFGCTANMRWYMAAALCSSCTVAVDMYDAAGTEEGVAMKELVVSAEMAVAVFHDVAAQPCPQEPLKDLEVSPDGACLEEGGG